jgi:hypothetical protein
VEAAAPAASLGGLVSHVATAGKGIKAKGSGGGGKVCE